MSTCNLDVVKFPHHKQEETCTTRAKYRQGKKYTAVKVYTVNNESQHLLICGVPALGLQDDLRRLGSRFGDIRSLVYIPRYAEEEFTDAYHIQYTRIQSARFAKHHMDGKSFYGGNLHVCYAPEMESIEETRVKLIQRRKNVAKRIRKEPELKYNSSAVLKQYHRQKKHPALPLTAERLSVETKDTICVWQGIPCDIDPRRITRSTELVKPFTPYGPLKPDDKWLQVGVKERRLIPNCSYKSSALTLPATIPLSSVSDISRYKVSTSSITSQVLRFIPRQVNAKKRIIFRNNRIPQTIIPTIMSHSVTQQEDNYTPNQDCTYDFSNALVEQTIQNVRKKIRTVSVPNVQVLLEQNDDV